MANNDDLGDLEDMVDTETFQEIKKPRCGICSKLSTRQKTVLVVVLTGLLMLGIVIVALLPLTKSDAMTRSYYIAAVEVEWDYAPRPYDVTTDQEFDAFESKYVENADDQIGRKYKKATFYGYTDDTFEERTSTPDSEDYLGLLGPIIRGQVGDTLEITVKNSLNFNITFVINGLQLLDVNGTVLIKDKVIAPNTTETFIVEISSTNGPSSTDFSSVAYSYYSTNEEVIDYNTGLCGVVVITKEGSADEDAYPTDVEQELVILASVFDENLSMYICENIQQYLQIQDCSLEMKNDNLIETNRKHAINGYLYGNQPNITITAGSRVRWYVIGLGEGTHTLIWGGQTLLTPTSRSGSVVVLPATVYVMEMVPMETGVWTVIAYGVDEQKGMSLVYTVTSAN